MEENEAGRNGHSGRTVAETKARVGEIVQAHRRRRGALIIALQQVQQAFGYLPQDAVSELARLLRVPSSEIYGVATFYSQFRLRPLGRNTVSVCEGTACHVRGASSILDAVERELGITGGETTPDLEYSLERVACIGACAISPALVVNDKVYGEMTPQKVKDLFTRLRPGASDAKE